MKRFLVSIPITGRVSFEVEAADEKAAIDVAEALDANVGDLEWETHRRIVRGNVFSGMQNEIEVELIEDDEATEKGCDAR